MVDNTSSEGSVEGSVPDPIDPGADYEPYTDLVTGRGDSNVEADYVDQGLGGAVGVEFNQYSPMGEVGVIGQMARSSALHRPGWRRKLFLGIIFSPIVAVVAAALVNALF